MDGLFKNPNKEPTQAQDPQNVVKLMAIYDSLEKLGKIAENPTEVSNFDEVKLHLRNELKILSDNFKKAFGGLKIPNSFKIEGIPKYPDKISISDIVIVDGAQHITQLRSLGEVINDLRAILSQVDFNPQIDIKHSYPDIKIPEIKSPKIEIPPINVPAPKVTVNPEVDLSELLSALEPLKYLSNKPGKPLSVRMSDGVKFIKALQEATKTAQKQLMQYVPGRGMSEDEFANKYKLVTQALTITSGRKVISTAGTREKLVAAATPCFRVDIGADTGNAGTPVVVGGVEVVALEGSMVGTVIIPGNIPHTIMIDDVSKIYADVGTDGDAVVFTYYTR